MNKTNSRGGSLFPDAAPPSPPSLPSLRLPSSTTNKQTNKQQKQGACAWEPGELEQQIKAGAWITAAAARPLLLKQVLALPVPLWQEVMALLGGPYAAQARAAAAAQQQQQPAADDGGGSGDGGGSSDGATGE